MAGPRRGPRRGKSQRLSLVKTYIESQKREETQPQRGAQNHPRVSFQGYSQDSSVRIFQDRALNSLLPTPTH